MATVRLFTCVLALASLATSEAGAQEADPSLPEPPPAPAPAPEPAPPPVEAPPPPPPPTPAPVPEEPIVLPEDPPAPPAPPPRAAPSKPPGRASFPPEQQPPPPRAAPAAPPAPSHAQPAAPVAPPPAAEPAAPPPSYATDPLAPPPRPPSDGEKEDDTDGVFGPFRIGGLVGVGLPSVVSFGGAIKLTRYFQAGLNVGVIPTISISLYGDAELSYQEYDLYARIFPLGGMFFLGAGVGYATIEGSLRSSYDLTNDPRVPPAFREEVFIESRASVRTLVLTPQLGLQHTFGSGFTAGIDVGAQIPLAPSEIEFETDLPDGIPQEVIDKYVEPNNQKVRDTLDTIGRAVVPTLNLRIGWFL